MTNHNISATWSAPSNIHAFTTSRQGGVSLPPYDSNNFGSRVGDHAEHVFANRKALVLPDEPQWLHQTHSDKCVIIEETSDRNADAAITREPNRCLAILTADCLPILLCNRQGTEIAAIHAGWRGFANGILESTLNQLRTPLSDFIAWIGPSACGKCYEVGSDVVDAFHTSYPFCIDVAWTIPLTDPSKFFANLPYLAEAVLKKAGITQINQSNLCTIEEKKLFYSYRRDGQTGRIATIIWFTEP